MAAELRCGVCGEAFVKRSPITLQEMIVRVDRLLCHLEPCSLVARYSKR